MQLYLAKPGGPKEGPYSLEKINADLAARKYRDDDYWAWHVGLTAWVPLYSIGGVAGAVDTTFSFAKPVPKGAPAPVLPPEPPTADTTILLAKRYGAELAKQQLRNSDHFEVARAVAATVAEPLSVQPQPPANPQAAASSPAAVAKPAPEPAQAATVTQAAPAAGAATAVSRDQDSQTPVHPSAPRSIAFIRAAPAPEQPRTASKNTAYARKRSSSSSKSPNGRSKTTRVRPQVAKAAKPFPIPRRRAFLMRRGVLLAAR